MSNNIIGKTAIKYSWPHGTKLSKYKYGPGKGYRDYTKTVKRMYPHAKNKKQKVGACCDIFVGTVLRVLGIDSKFPMHLKDQQKYMQKERFKKIFYKVGKGVSVSKLKGGDVQIKKNHHIRIVVEINGGKKYIANAHYKRHKGCYAVIDDKASKDSKKYVTYRLRKDPTTTGSKTNKKSTTTKKATPKSTSNQVTYYVSKIPTTKDVAAITNILNKEIVKDTSNLKKIYSDYKSSVNSNSIFNSQSLIKQYENILKFLQNKIGKVSNFTNNKQYIYFYQNNKNSYPHLITYPDDYDKNCIYYTASIGEKKWVELYQDFYLKYKALEYYNLSIKNYKSVQSYIQNLYPELSVNYNKKLSNLYKQMKEFVEKNTDNFNSQDALKEINNKISEIEITLNNINKELSKDYKDRTKLEQELQKYQQILENMLQTKNNFKQNNFSDVYTYWNKKIIQEPNLLNFWLEFSNSNEMNNYTVKNIGRKAYGATNEQVKSIYYREVPQVIYYNVDDISKTKTGYVYLKINNMDTLFTNSSQGLSAKNVIDDLLYQYSYCSQQLNLSIIPIHYLEPNTRILIHNEKTKVNNEYIINKISNPISYNGNMTINATQVSERLY